MKGDNNNKTVPFKEQMEGERKLFLGKLTDEDLVPGSDITLGQAKENFAKTNAEFQARKIAKQTSVLTQKNEAEKDEYGLEKASQTRMVIPGVLVEVENQVPTITDVVARPTVLPDLPSDEELKKLSTEDLIALAVGRGVGVKANVDDEATIIAKLRGTYIEPVTDDLTGKKRSELEDIVKSEFDLDGTNKEMFPNVESLFTYIRKRRETAEV